MTNMRSNISMILVVVLGLIIVGTLLLWLTNRPEAPTQLARSTQNSAHTIAGSSTTTTASALQAARQIPDARRKLPTDFADMLSAFDATQQQFLMEFYSAFGEGMMDFSTPEQFAWLDRRGFPMPEDLLAARFLSDEQLQQMSDAGSLTASAVLLNRLIRRTKPENYPEISSELSKLVYGSTASGSPFSGYLYGRFASNRAMMEYAAQPELGRKLATLSQLVGFEWAGLLGDSRVTGFGNDTLQSARTTFQQLPWTEGDGDYNLIAMDSLGTIISFAIHANPLVFSKRDDRWPVTPNPS